MKQKNTANVLQEMSFRLKKIILTIVSVIHLGIAFGQDSLIQTKAAPVGLKVSLDKVNHPTAFMDMKCIGTLTFSNSKKTVDYLVFNYQPSDSLAFEKIKWERLKMENCKSTGNKAQERNFRSFFILEDYIFFIQFCPGGGSSRGQCGNLARKINQWISDQ